MAINHDVIFKFENQGGEGFARRQPILSLSSTASAPPPPRPVFPYGKMAPPSERRGLPAPSPSPLSPSAGTGPRLPPFRKGTWRRPMWDRRLPAESFLPLPDIEEPPRWPLPTRARRGGPLAASAARDAASEGQRLNRPCPPRILPASAAAAARSPAERREGRRPLRCR